MSTRTKMSTIQCPKCGQTLPGWSQQCQFCGASMTPGFVRPVDAYANAVDNRMTWKEVSYVVVSVLIVLQGVYSLLLGFDVIPNLGYKWHFGTFFGLTGSVECILGVGMLFHQLWAQFIMKWACILGIFMYGLLTLQGLMFASDPRIGWGPFFIQLLNLAVVSFTLYLLYSEADV